MKKLWVLCFCLIAISAEGADYLETYKDYRYAMRDKLDLDTASNGGLDDTTAHKFIRESVMFLSPVLNLIIIEDTFLTAKYDNSYVLDSLFLGIFAVEWRSRDSLKSLTYCPRELWHQLKIDPNLSKMEVDNYLKRPSVYDYLNRTIYLYPSPYIGLDSFMVAGWAKMPNQISADSLKNVPVKYRITVLRYATYLAAVAMTDPRMSIFYRDFQDATSIFGEAYARVYKQQPVPSATTR